MDVLVAKMHGGGNDFVVVPCAPPEEPAAVVRLMADRRRGIGADGVLFIEEAGGGAVRMTFYNRDGTLAGLCLNGSRCVALRAVQLGWCKDEVQIVTRDQTLEAQVETSGREGEVELSLDPPRKRNAPVALPGEWRQPGWIVETGDPHLVVEVEAEFLDECDFEALARPLREWTAPNAEGSNVHFIVRDGSPWLIRSFERGVEAETLACGSGCVSAVAALARRTDRRVSLQTRSGATLVVEPGDPRWSLRGPAALTFETNWSLA